MVSTGEGTPYYSRSPGVKTVRDFRRRPSDEDPTFTDTQAQGCTPPKNAYPLATKQFQLKIDIFASKNGKQKGYNRKHQGIGARPVKKRLPTYHWAAYLLTSWCLYGKDYDLQLNFGKHVHYNLWLSRLLSMVSDYHAYDAV